MSKIEFICTGSKVVVVGDVMIDRYIYGKSTRISPEAPVAVLSSPQTDDRLGGSANVAINIKSLGEDCELFALTGKDNPAREIGVLLSKAGIKYNFSVDEFRDTTVKLRIISQGQQLVRIDYESNKTFCHSQKWYSDFKESIAEAKVVILSDYEKGCLSDCQRLINICAKVDVPVFVDPKGTSFSKYAGASLLTPNEKELVNVIGKYNSIDDLKNKVFKLIDELNFGGVLLTRSEKGMLFFSNNKVIEFKASAKEVVDVTGAGDTVIAAIATFFSRGCSLYRSIELANVSAGIVVGKARTSTLTSSEVSFAINRKNSEKVFSRRELKNLVFTWRKKGDVVVFTNGCFDILHAGHAEYLEKAKRLGTKLVVAVNSDSSIRTLKGLKRPINNERERIKLLSSLQSIDAVILFDEKTPYELYKEITPDILVKGGDYKKDEIIGSHETIASGGSVEIIPFETATSTTQIIEKILKIE